jgi:hypothetical protein
VRGGAVSTPRGNPAGIAKRQVDALNRRDLDEVVALYAEDAVLSFPASAPVIGRNAIRRAYARFFADWDEEITILSFAVSGSIISASGVAQGRHKTIRLDIPGRIPVPLHPYRHTFTATWEISRGEILRHTIDYDSQDLVRRLLGT